MNEQFEAKVDQLRAIKQAAALGGGQGKIDRLHADGRMTAREMIDELLDTGSFCELNMLVGYRLGTPTDGIIVGHGTVDGREVCVYAQDSTVLSGSIGALHGHKMYTLIETALDMGVPLIGIHDSPGARAVKTDESLRANELGATDLIRFRDDKSGSSVFYVNTEASGVIPQIAAVVGSCAGIAVYSPALNDFVFMVDGLSHMFITGPKVVQSVLSECVTKEELGGARIHSKVSGVADFRTANQRECLLQIKKLLSYLPSNYREKPPRRQAGDDPMRLVDNLTDIVPVNPHKSYDMHRVIGNVVDCGEFLEVKAEFAPEMIVGFGRLDGFTVGIVANQPLVRAGSLTVDSSDKEARFIRFCDSFNIPLVFLIDTPAYLPGTSQEHAGIIRHGAKVIYALCEAVVPRVAVILRKAYGGGGLGMGIAPGLKTDFVFAWPTAETGPMGAEQAVALLHEAEIAKAEHPEQLREQKIQEYRARYGNPLTFASMYTHIDDVIEPRQTRQRVISALKLLRNKAVSRHPKRHGNIPL